MAFQWRLRQYRAARLAMKRPQASSRYCRECGPSFQDLQQRSDAEHAAAYTARHRVHQGPPRLSGQPRLCSAAARVLKASLWLDQDRNDGGDYRHPRSADGLRRSLAGGKPGARRATGLAEPGIIPWIPVPPGPDDLVSVVVSIADQRAIVFQGGKKIDAPPYASAVWPAAQRLTS